MARKSRRVATPPERSGGGSRRLIIGGVVVIAVAGLLTLLILSLQGPRPIEGLIDNGTQVRGHDNSVSFEGLGLPPAGGLHADRWQQCGIYDAPIDTANAVHSLEHGAVWITYQPDLPAADVEALKGYTRGQSHVLLSPFPGQQSPVALTAWRYQLEVTDPGDRRVEQFLDRYVQGPQTPEPGATCSGPGSVGVPTG